ncbi:hypothetical protein D3C80_1773730 [compost metagenome]
MLFTHLLVQVFGEGLRQAVRQRLDHDLVVIIVLRVVSRRQLIFLQPAGHGESAEIIGLAAAFRRDKVCQTVVREVGFFRLLAQVTADHQHLVAVFVAIHLDVVTDAVGREQAVDAARIEAAVGGQHIQHLVGIGE